MTHAKDRTLLAALGFADPDKQNPAHDFACQYLAQADIAARLASTLTSDKRKMRTGHYQIVCPCQTGIPRCIRAGLASMTDFSFDRYCSVPTITHTSLEHPITKGEGQYKTHIGFLDLAFHYVYEQKDCGQYFRHELVDYRGTTYPELPKRTPAEWVPHTIKLKIPGTILVEVKTGKTSIGAILRQIRLYNEYLDGLVIPFRMATGDLRHQLHWVLATPYPFDTVDIATLDRAGIAHVMLGSQFSKYMEGRAQHSPVICDSLEL
jgi:hypothetical protein